MRHRELRLALVALLALAPLGCDEGWSDGPSEEQALEDQGADSEDAEEEEEQGDESDGSDSDDSDDSDDSPSYLDDLREDLETPERENEDVTEDLGDEQESPLDP